MARLQRLLILAAPLFSFCTTAATAPAARNSTGELVLPTCYVSALFDMIVPQED
jgi:hypothetical protein